MKIRHMAAAALAGAAFSGAYAEVPELLELVPQAKGYELVYKLDPLKYAGDGYQVDNSENISGKVVKVGYLLKTSSKDGKKTWVFASFDPFSQDLSKIGVPDYGSGVIQTYVDNLEVFGNGKVKTGKFERGNIEFWPFNYGGANKMNIPNATGAFDFGDSAGTDGVALVTRKKAYYFTDSRYIEAAHNKVQDAEIAMTDAAHPYVDLINAAMEKTHVQKLGFEDAYMTVADYRHYSEKLHCQMVPATELLISLRQSKDEEEIQRMIAAQRIAEAALDQIVKEIKPGVTEKEIAARLQYLMLAGGAENMSFDPIVASGPNGSMPHAVPTDRKIQDGDFVTMDFGCIYQGYCSDMTRTVAVGHVTEEMEKVYNVVLQAQLAGIAAAKAGATGHDVDAAARKVIEDAGYGPYFGHSFGHSVGVEIHESPNATPANNKPLPLGAAVSAEPGIYLPGRFGVRIEDVVVLQEGGCQDITLAKKDLLIL